MIHLLFLVFLCGVILKLHTFPMNFIAGPSVCVLESSEVEDASSCLVSTVCENYTATDWRKTESLCEEDHEFIQNGHVARLSFLVYYGFFKATMNFVTGTLCDRFGRKPVLAVGWVVGIPGAIMVLAATNFGTVASSNIFLGLNQAMAWSTVIYMLIDICGKKSGLAVGLGETMGYTGAALANSIMGDIVNSSDARTLPYGLEFVILAGCAVYVVFLVSETSSLVNKNHRNVVTSKHVEIKTPSGEKNLPISKNLFVFLWTTAFNTTAVVTCLAGLCINLSTALIWGLIPEVPFYALHVYSFSHLS